MSARWWLRQARTLADPAGATATRMLLERSAPQRLQRLRAAARDRIGERRSPTRAKMRALVLRPGGRFAWASLPAPAPPGPQGATVRPIAIATCDMDRPIALGGTPFLPPLSIGHECVAEVLAVGSDVATIRPGQRVVVPFQISCGACAPCRAGQTANCQAVPPASMYGFGISGGHWGGAIADELAVPFADGMLVALPDGLDPAAAASVADNVSDAYRHIGPYLPDLLARDPEAKVLIVGAQSQRHLFTASVSLYAGLIAKALGGRDVTLADARPSVRRDAERLGLASVTIDEAQRGELAPLVADVSATPAGLGLALRMTAPDGICSSSGTLHAKARIPALLMYGRNATLKIARAHARALIPEVLGLMSGGSLHPERVTSAIADFDDARAALTEHVGAGYAKTVLRRL